MISKMVFFYKFMLYSVSSQHVRTTGKPADLVQRRDLTRGHDIITGAREREGGREECPTLYMSLALVWSGASCRHCLKCWKAFSTLSW